MKKVHISEEEKRFDPLTHISYPSRIVSQVVAPHWLGLEDSLCEWLKGGLVSTAVCCTPPPPPPPVPRPQHVLLRLSNTATQRRPLLNEEKL